MPEPSTHLHTTSTIVHQTDLHDATAEEMAAAVDAAAAAAKERLRRPLKGFVCLRVTYLLEVRPVAVRVD